MFILASVGRGGANLPADVRRVQAALNAARTVAGLPAIGVDGWAGRQTLDAIQAFQQAATSSRDGRIDPHGPTARALVAACGDVVEAQVRRASQEVIDTLHRELQARGLSIPPGVQASFASVVSGIAILRGTGAPAPLAQPAIYYPSQRRMTFQPVMAAAAAPAVAAEALLLMLLAMIALLIVIQMAPAMSRSLEDLMRRIQVLMSELVDKIEEAVKGIEDLIARNPRAGMTCSGAVIAFRQLSAELLRKLAAPRPIDDIGRQRLKNELLDMMTRWQAALQAVMDCLTGAGAT